MWLGINNYSPDFIDNTEQFITKHDDMLHSLIGQSIDGINILWNKTEDEFYSIAPVLFKISEIQIELCANKLDEFSLTYNLIDPLTEVEPSDMGDGEVWFYEWRRYSGFIKSSTITGIDILELLFESRVIHDKDNPELIGQQSSNWLLHGIGLQTLDYYVTVYNAFDCNGVSFNKEPNEYIKYRSL
ncbi:hypothetical protein DNH61_04780 [Paenibacillus sambharensis]|uniref:Uncharacterized protein n=1 Tax=Paenibacillus sambharensis TaxID=1803190 RepID=A0A2W1LQ91_9BACL|nr:hypothetical protein [Paenibacillus sambharensis]PZD97015.1 hypothetical protein DNH61_04780 [Paenibacillus sambharensis]